MPAAINSPTEPCPLCGQDNGCRVAQGHLYKGPCWCHEIIVPGQLLNHLAGDQLDPACFCRPCLETIAQLARELPDTASVLEELRRRRPAQPPADPEFYLDEFGHTVFTAAYHLKRGNCCDNGCRHCPY